MLRVKTNKDDNEESKSASREPKTPYSSLGSGASGSDKISTPIKTTSPETKELTKVTQK
jgi:hypothetical protein